MANQDIVQKLKNEPEGDAANFISLGVGLAEFQKYGQVNFVENGEITAFKPKEINDYDLNFIGHSTWRPPVWPLIIAGIFLLFGYNLSYLLIFKFLLHLIGIFIFYKTLRLLKLQEILIIVGTFLFSISPSWQIYSRVFLSEPITLFFITLWLYLLILFLKQRSGFIHQALVGGILILSHPYYIFLPFAIWLMLFFQKKINFKVFIFSSLICAAVVSTWIIRNFIVLETDDLILTTSTGAVMAKGWNPDVVKKHTNTKGDLAEEELVLINFPHENKSRNEVESFQLYKSATKHFIKSNPEMILPIIGKKLKSAFNPFPETPRPGILETGRWFYHFLAFLSLIYILIFIKNKLIRSLATGLILSTIGITILTYSGFRFRMPQIGLEILFIIYVISDIFRSIKYRILNLQG